MVKFGRASRPSAGLGVRELCFALCVGLRPCFCLRLQQDGKTALELLNSERKVRNWRFDLRAEGLVDSWVAPGRFVVDV